LNGFAWVYGGVMMLALLRLGRGWLAAQRLLRGATAYAMDAAERAAWEELGIRLKVKLPLVWGSAEVRSPVLVGILRPELLLPAGFAGLGEAERRAALGHELAHLARRDCLVNGICQLAAIPLAWHPLVHAVERRIARTREMVCDQLAAGQMQDGDGRVLYARCLLGLARTMVRDGERLADAGLGLFGTNKLEERVMKLTEEKRVLSAREMWVRRAGGAAVAGAVLVAGAMVRVAPVVAQESAPVAPLAPSAPRTPEVPLAPAGPLALAGPLAPAAPLAPSAPRTPDVPLAPAGPLAPIAVSASQAPSLPEVPVPSQTPPSGLVQVPAPPPVPPSGLVQAPGLVPAPAPPPAPAHPALPPEGSTGDGRASGLDEEVRALTAKRLAESQAELNKLNSPEFRKQIRDAAEALSRSQVALQMAKTQMQELTGPAMEKQMAELEGQLATLESAETRVRLDQAERLDTAEMEARLAAAEKRLDEASKRMEAAQRSFDAAQRRLESGRTKLKP
jgi:beta-lactamase regulating signal transducer with metallopeptidase domain